MQAILPDEISDNLLRAAIREIVPLESVLNEVSKNYAANRWWPLTVVDWRLRMLLAGWTTRVGYTSIHHYQSIVARASNLGFDAICKMSDSEVTALTQPIGLAVARIQYLRSLTLYIASHDANVILNGDPDVVISEFAKSVDGASFKVAQCAVLYAKGYHSGIIPIDSGMCDMLAPAIPIPYQNHGIGHEIVRKRLELFVANNISFLHSELRSHTYVDHTPQMPTWWIHLLLIYYKRLYWNRGKSQIFPRDGKYSVSNIVGRPNLSRFPYVVIEGPDGVGKSTMASTLTSAGYAICHCKYTPHPYKSLANHYEEIINTTSKPTVFDRFFFSELAYGNALRSGSRISPSEAEHLLLMMKQKGFVAFFLTDSQANITARRGEIPHLKKLMSEYRSVFNTVRDKMTTYWLNSSTLSPAFFPSFFEI